MILIEL